MMHLLGLYLGILCGLLTLRLLWILPRKRSSAAPPTGSRRRGCRTLVVLGSGGHTTEMIKLVSALSDKYYPRLYVAAETDKMSHGKAVEYESAIGRLGKVQVIRIPRSREVGQSYATSVFTTLRSVWSCFPIVFNFVPDLILCNGPGTCIPICFVGLLLRFVGLKWVRIIYVESIARVESLSLAGRLLYPFADRFVVLWPELAARYPQAEYIGRLF
eukprot:Opistho-2@85818